VTPPMGTFAQDLYGRLAPVAVHDESLGWPLAYFCEALGQMFQDMEDVVRDSEDGPGWSSVMDLTRVPLLWLPWLAQFIGVTLPKRLDGETDGDYRTRAALYVSNRPGFKRGTPAAMIAAAKETLTGSQYVLFDERNPDAYGLLVRTRTAETASEADTLAALMSQKPAGIVLDYDSLTGRSYQEVKLAYATYTLLAAGNATYTILRDS
jgi:hypothetical protein